MQSKQAPSTRSDAETSLSHGGIDGDSWRLASQLSAEARHLATVYPPNPAVVPACRAVWSASHPPHRGLWSRASRAWWISTCVGILLAVGLGTQLLRSRSAPSPSTARTPPLRDPPSAVASRAESAADQSTVISPVMFVSELSDPELEAWLDLQRDAASERIAF